MCELRRMFNGLPEKLWGSIHLVQHRSYHCILFEKGIEIEGWTEPQKDLLAAIDI